MTPERTSSRTGLWLGAAVILVLVVAQLAWVTMSHPEIWREMFAEGGITAWQNHWRSESEGAWYTLRVEGKVEFSEDGTRIERMEPGSFFFLQEWRAGRWMRVEAEPGEDGAPRYACLVREDVEGGLPDWIADDLPSEYARPARTHLLRWRTVPFSGEVRDWLAANLPRGLRDLGVMAETLVPHFYHQGGADAVLRELDRIRSPRAMRHHLQEYFALDGLTREELAMGAGRIERIWSPYQQAHLLETIAPRFLEDEALRPVFFEAVRGIRSPRLRGQVLASVLTEGEPSKATLLAGLEAVAGIESSSVRTEVLVRLAPVVRDEGDLRAAYLRVAGTIGTPEDRERALRALEEESRVQPGG